MSRIDTGEEPTRYGTLKAWAKQLGLDEAVALLDQTLQEEKAADEKLSQVGESIANAAAGEGEVEQDEEDKEEEDEEEEESKKDATEFLGDDKPTKAKKSPKKAA